MFNQLDPRDVDAISRFIGFMELMSDKTKLDSFVKDVKAGIADLQTANGVHKTLKAVEDYKAKLQKEHAASLVALERREKDLVIASSKAQKENEQSKEALYKEMLALNLKLEDARKREIAVASLEKAVTEKAKAQAEKEERLVKFETSLRVLESNLNTKAAKLKDILG